MQALEGEPVRAPQREVVEPDERVDREARVGVVPRRRAEESTQRPAARVLDDQDPGAVGGASLDRAPVPQTIVQRLEERLREPVDRHVEEAARSTPTGTRRDEDRIDRPAREAVDEVAHHPTMDCHGDAGGLASTADARRRPRRPASEGPS